MCYNFRLVGLLAMLAVCGLAAASAQGRQARQTNAQQGAGPVVVVELKGAVDKPLAAYLRRSLETAAAQQPGAIVLDIDTYGGLVDAADDMRQAILGATFPTVAFINPNAASAGALISYAADYIVMAPGASIGAATVVNGGDGRRAPDKYQSYMRGLMRATAEAKGRDPRIAEAMVDENVVAPGIKAKGTVLTLSANEAQRLGVADTVLANVEALRTWLRLEQRPILEQQATATDRVLRFFASPIIQSILMLIMLGGLYAEMHSPGVGLPALISLAAATLFFAPNYLYGLVESWEILLFGIGVVLLLIEIFVLPGFGVAGASGLGLIILSLLASLVGNDGWQFPSLAQMSPAILTLTATLVLLVVFGLSMGRYMQRSSRLNQLVLTPSLVGYTSSEAPHDIVGKQGVTLTPLRPVGRALIDGAAYEVTTAGDYLAAGKEVEVARIRNGQVEVRASAALS